MTAPAALPDATEQQWLDGPAGRLCLYHAGPPPGSAAAALPPLLLVHSINAAASAREMRPVFDALATQRPVAALDLPGYGCSERSDRPYTLALMSAAVQQAGAALRQRWGAAAVDGMALSLGCEYLARAALAQPAAWRTLALISPTGLGGRRFDGPSGQARGSARVHRVLSNPRWAPWLFAQLTRPGVIRYFLNKTWGSPQIDEDLWRFDTLTTQVPGARHAPLYFLSGQLFAADISRVYDQLPQPVWVAHGTRGDFTDYRGLPPRVQASGGRWQQAVFDGGAMPHFEHAAQFLQRWAAACPPA